MTISVITAFFNNETYTVRCIRSILDSLSQNNNAEIIEIFAHSNGSTPESFEVVRKAFETDPRVKMINSQIPLGYARAFNFPIQFCQGDYILLVNNDVMLYSDWLNRLVKPFEEYDESLGISSVMWINNKDTGLCGGECMLVKKSVFNSVGLLNETFFPAYGEDHEFSLRVKNAGYKITAVANVIEGSDGHMKSIDYPMLHESNVTTSLFGDVRVFIEKNVSKLHNIYNKNLMPVLLHFKDEKRAIDWINNIENRILYTDKCRFLIVAEGLHIANAIHMTCSEFLQKDNVFLIPRIFGEQGDSAEAIATTFFCEQPVFTY